MAETDGGFESKLRKTMKPVREQGRQRPHPLGTFRFQPTRASAGLLARKAVQKLKTQAGRWLTTSERGIGDAVHQIRILN